jgi:hypothetical protein
VTQFLKVVSLRVESLTSLKTNLPLASSTMVVLMRSLTNLI